MTTIGFDLDMTLIDSRPGIGAALHQVAEESGHPIDVDLATSRLGPPLAWELAHWMPENQVDRWVERFRAIYPDVAIPAIATLPGAVEALAAVNRIGRSLVISAKHRPNVQRHVDHLDLPASAVFGDAWREQKAVVLRAEGAAMYVGDHVHDMDAATGAGVIGIGVATGSSSADELRDAGADLVLDTLHEFDRALALLPS